MELKWDERGLLPAVAQDATTGAVLMVAWMNAESLALTLSTHEAHFFSRSRGQLWRKGETSGNVLAVRDVRTDCDADCILLLVAPHGPACHTGRTSCFHQPLPHGEIDDGPRGAPSAILDRLAGVIAARRDAPDGKSYTHALFAAGMPKILAKIAEEHGELAVELRENGPRDKIVHETADLIYHVLVGLAARDVPIAGVWAELERRFGKSGLAEKAARPPKL